MAQPLNQVQQLKELAALAGKQQKQADEKAALVDSLSPVQQPPTIIIQTPKG